MGKLGLCNDGGDSGNVCCGSAPNDELGDGRADGNDGVVDAPTNALSVVICFNPADSELVRKTAELSSEVDNAARSVDDGPAKLTPNDSEDDTRNDAAREEIVCNQKTSDELIDAVIVCGVDRSSADIC
jgi:hypothetical protein